MDGYPNEYKKDGMVDIYLFDYFDIGRANGLSTYVRELSRGLKQRSDIQLHYVWIHSQSEHRVLEKEGKEGAIHYYIPKHISDMKDHSGYDLEVADFLAKDMRKQAQVIVHFNWINHCVFGRILKKKVDCTTLLTKHCIPWRDFITGKYETFKELDELLVSEKKHQIIPPALKREWISYDSVDHVIAVTHFAKKALINLLDYPQEKIDVIYNGLDLSGMDMTRRNKLEIKKKYGFATREKIVLYAGSMDERKGLFDLVRGFEKLIDRYDGSVRLVLAGSGNHAGVLDKIERFWSKITFTGNIDKSTLYDLYSVADIGVVPSYVEQCSFTTIEMMHAGLPIIVSNIDGLREMVPDRGGLKVERKLGKKAAYIDAEELAEKIYLYLAHPERAKEYATEARKRAKEQFQSQKMVDATIAVYEKMITSEEKNTVGKKRQASPLVSILLPCYNGEKYLQECIQSIMKQTYNHFELILVDDGSTDNSEKIIRRYHDSRIRFIKNKKNKGIRYSLNRALSLVKGRYVARLDSDDQMHPQRLEKQVQFLERSPSVALVGSGHYVVDMIGRPLNLMDYPIKDKDIRSRIWFRNPFSHPAIMVRTEVLKEFGYSDRYKYCEDYYLWFRIAERYEIANLPDYLTFYRVHDKNISSSHQKMQRQHALSLISDQLSKTGLRYSTEEMMIHGAICFGYGKRFFNSKEKIKKLNNWLDRLLSHLAEMGDLPVSYIDQTKNDIISCYCSLNPFSLYFTKTHSKRNVC